MGGMQGGRGTLWKRLHCGKCIAIYLQMIKDIDRQTDIYIYICSFAWLLGIQRGQRSDPKRSLDHIYIYVYTYTFCFDHYL